MRSMSSKERLAGKSIESTLSVKSNYFYASATIDSDDISLIIEAVVYNLACNLTLLILLGS
jgi:hypothetical protein